jgi:hypothetical protein
MLLVGPPMPDRSRVMTPTKRDTLVLQVGGLAWGQQPHTVKTYCYESRTKEKLDGFNDDEESWWQIGKNGRILFDKPKPTVGCSASGRRRRMNSGSQKGKHSCGKTKQTHLHVTHDTQFVFQEMRRSTVTNMAATRKFEVITDKFASTAYVFDVITFYRYERKSKA